MAEIDSGSIESPLAGLKRDATHTLAATGRGLMGIGSAKSLSRATWAVSIAGAAIIAVLSLRVWLQLSGDAQTGLVGNLYDLGGWFAAPFRPFEPSTPIHNTGILEFSTLVAIEAYLVGTLVALTVLLSARIALFAGSQVVQHRRRRAPREKALVVADSSQAT